MDARAITHSLGGAWRNGRGQAPCPVCQPERRKDQTALSLAQANGKLLLHCFKSDCNFVDIANAAGTNLGAVQVDFNVQREHERKRREYQATKLQQARSLWDAAKPIQGTKAESYLRSRGITARLPDSLRFLPDIHHGPSMKWGCAMVADVQPTGGVHRTYFDKQGNRLPKDAKMMLGPCAGGAVCLSDSDGPLVVCEGIETGLSLLSGLLSGPVSVWAALSAPGMKALELTGTPGKLVIAIDGDKPGRDAGNALAARASALGWEVGLLPAPNGKDWNDVLTGKGGAS